MPSVREGWLARSHNGVWENVQFFLTIPAGTTTRVVYSPPSEFWYIPIYHNLGPVSSGVIVLFVTVDDDVEFPSTVSANSVTDYLFEKQITYVVRNNFTANITNNDTVPHHVDGFLSGFLMPKNCVNEYLEEVSGRKQLKETLETNKLLMEINEKLKVGGTVSVQSPAPSPSPQTAPKTEPLSEKRLQKISDTMTSQNTILERILESLKETPILEREIQATTESHKDIENALKDIEKKLSEI